MFRPSVNAGPGCATKSGRLRKKDRRVLAVRFYKLPGRHAFSLVREDPKAEWSPGDFQRLCFGEGVQYLGIAELEVGLEAAIGIEPMNKGFADLCLTTWLRRH